MSMHVSSNAFLGTRQLTASREDHLTEFFAAALQLCPEFALDYARLALWEIAPAGGWKGNPFKMVETQVAYSDDRCRPDMRITLADNRVDQPSSGIEGVSTDLTPVVLTALHRLAMDVLGRYAKEPLAPVWTKQIAPPW